MSAVAPTFSTTIHKRDAPTYTLKIYAKGQKPERADDVTSLIISADFDDDDAKADKLTLTLNNFDLSVFDDPRWRKGNYLQFTWGYQGNVAPTRTCIIQSIKGSTVLSIEALSQSILMHKQVRSRTFDHMTRSQVVTSIAAEYGYSGTSVFVDDTSVVLPHVTQARMTDAQFMKSLAQREGFEFYVDYEGFHWKRRKVGQTPKRKFVYYVDPNQGDILSFNVDNDVTVTPGSVNAKGRDPLNKSDIDVTASNTDTDRDGLAGEMEVVDPRTKTTQTVAVAAGDAYNTNAKSASDAQREANGKFIKAQQAIVRMTVEAIGDPGIAAKQVVYIDKISQRLSGPYYLKNVKHKLTAQSYLMTMTCRSDGAHAKQLGVTKSDANQNAKDAGDPNALVPIDSVDPRTKQVTTVYRPAGSSQS